jgi:membrane associated rhomboid family serine protease
MTITNLSWRLHSNVISNQLRTILFVISAALAISVRSIILNNPSMTPLYITLAVVSYTVIVAIIIIRYKDGGGKNRSVTVNENIISIPRIIFNNQLVHFNEIKSLEKFYNSKDINMIVIGRFDKSSIAMEPRSFHAKQDFDSFLEYLSREILSKEVTPESADIAVISQRRAKNSSIASIIVTLMLLMTYIVTTYPSIEYINNNAVAQGGLNKETLHWDQVYRIAASFFLHHTPFHLLFNILSLGIISQYLVVILRNVRFVNILLGSAICGSLLSLALSPFQAVIGASGGLVGLVGAYLLVLTKYKRSLPGSVSVSSRAMFSAIFLQAVCDVAIEGTDVFSHLGGFIFGFLYATFCLYKRTAANSATVSFPERWLATCIASLYVCGLAYFLTLYLPIR